MRPRHGEGPLYADDDVCSYRGEVMSKLKGFGAACALVLAVSALLAGVCTGSARAGGVVFFIDAQHGWESTTDGASKATAWRTSNSGASWKQLATRPYAITAGNGASGGFFAFATRSTGLWVCAGHTVLRTTNAGASWQSLPGVPGAGSPGGSWLSDASFATTRVGWACSQSGSSGLGGSITKTSNAGASWHVQKRIAGTDQSGGFLQVSCPTASSCYVLGWGYKLGGLWATADGGKHWTRRQLPSDVFSTSIDFPTADSGWAVGYGGVMYATTNGGRTWHNVDTGTGEDLKSVSFCSSKIGYAVGASGTVLRTTDAGATWVTLSDPGYDGMDYSEVQCVDATHAWICAEYSGGTWVYVTSDGGNTWEENSIFLD